MRLPILLNSLPVFTLRGVGPKVAAHLAKLSIENVQDLLFHLPLRYEDRTRITPIHALQAGDRRLIEGVVSNVKITGRRRQLSCLLTDDTGTINLQFFHFTAIQKQRLETPGIHIRCFGEVRGGFKGYFTMVHPEYRQTDVDDPLPLSTHLTPIYPTTKGLNQIALRKLIEQALTQLQKDDAFIELLPHDVLAKKHFPTLLEALLTVHHPSQEDDMSALLAGTHPAQQRLAFEELIAHQLSMQNLRKQMQAAPAVAMAHDATLAKQCQENLPFTLTHAQSRVLQEIKHDLTLAKPMLRLVQGDVGSGKTIVAALAALDVIEQGCQVALMAPTEILAEQHYQNMLQWLSPLGVKVSWLIGSHTAKQRNALLPQLAKGEVQLLVGTHALFQQEVQFNELALLIVDEQHRFGVHQRMALKEKGMQQGRVPHQLIMTATPIPRTLAMTAYANLDYSVIDALPPGRQPISTRLVSQSRREEVLARVRASCLQGRQAYWICTLVEESEALQCQAAEVTAVELREALPDLRIGLMHGRQKSDEKEAVMTSFKVGDIDLLVATTVVEVGVDVPNASLMVIENPERLGLAQLHQLRGRIGRGSIESHCVLLYKSPLSLPAQQRLAIMRETQDGFEIAKQDLLMRGPGEVLGAKQAGLIRMRVADILRDKNLLPIVQEVGHYLEKKHPEITDKLIARWIVDADKYASI